MLISHSASSAYLTHTDPITLAQTNIPLQPVLSSQVPSSGVQALCICPLLQQWCAPTAWPDAPTAASRLPTLQTATLFLQHLLQQARGAVQSSPKICRVLARTIGLTSHTSISFAHTILSGMHQVWLWLWLPAQLSQKPDIQKHGCYKILHWQTKSRSWFEIKDFFF